MTLFRNEPEFVRWLERRTAARAPGLRLGIGDDAALIEPRPDAQLALTTDLSVEGIHFSRRLHPPGSIGHRALARSLSDIAAMGAVPRFALLSCALSRRADRQWVESFFGGFLRLARRFKVAVLGGDTARGGARTMIDVAVLGEIPKGNAMRRSGARAGDQIYVAGPLGFSALGLRLLRSGETRDRGITQRAIRAHLYPEPQCALGCFLAEERLASAAIDVSDGLSSDLARLCESSGVGAVLFAEKIPGPAPFGPWTARHMLSLALNGGEDYVLLFTARPSAKLPSSYRGITLSRIGEVTAARARVLVEPGGKQKPLAPHGYDHFSRHATQHRR
ncbi:MAG: thiamine-phosphate kinase [Terriglobia bacterium]